MGIAGGNVQHISSEVEQGELVMAKYRNSLLFMVKFVKETIIRMQLFGETEDGRKQNTL